jgi:hypothetical protein
MIPHLCDTPWIAQDMAYGIAAMETCAVIYNDHGFCIISHLKVTRVSNYCDCVIIFVLLLAV